MLTDLCHFVDRFQNPKRSVVNTNVLEDSFKYVANKMNQDRLAEKDFCDFTIKTDTQEFPVHRCVVGVTSEFFKRLFLTNMKEKYESYVIIETISAETMQTVIEFIYGQPTSINLENAFEVLEAADYLQIQHLVKHCQNVLEGSLCRETALKTWKLAKSFNFQNLLEKSIKIITENFASVLSQQEFLQSELNVIEEILKLRGGTFSEENFYQSIENWVRFDIETRQTFFCKLFKLIELKNICSEFLRESISFNSLVLENPESCKHLMKFMNEKLIKYETIYSSENAASRRLNSNEIIVIGGIHSPSLVRKYNVNKRQWNYNMSDIESNCIYAGLAFLDNKMYIMGGKPPLFSQNSFNDLECYDHLNGSTTSLNSMFHKRHKFGCTVQDGKIYVVGGMAHKTEWLFSCERYTPSTDKWECGPHLNNKRTSCCLVSFNSCLYALGGNNKKNCLSSVERIQLKGKSFFSRFNSFYPRCSWEFKASMNFCRSDFAAVVLCGKLYAIGGRNDNNCLDSVEKYDDRTDLWSYVASLNFARSGHGACVVGGKIYVLGGECGGNPVAQIEVYDPEQEKWEVYDNNKIDSNLIGAAMVPL